MNGLSSGVLLVKGVLKDTLLLWLAILFTPLLVALYELLAANMGVGTKFGGRISVEERLWRGESVYRMCKVNVSRIRNIVSG